MTSVALRQMCIIWSVMHKTAFSVLSTSNLSLVSTRIYVRPKMTIYVLAIGQCLILDTAYGF